MHIFCLKTFYRILRAYLRKALAGGKGGFSLLELTITLVVGAILMMGMLPLIRIAADRGVEMQLQMRDVVELQSLSERLSAYAAGETNLTAVKVGLGEAPAAKSGIGSLGNFYLHSSDYIYFDSANNAQTTNGVSNLLAVKFGLEPNGPSLSKILKKGSL